MSQEIVVIQPLPGLGDLAWFDEHMQAVAATSGQKTVTLLTTPALAPRIFAVCQYVKEVICLDSSKKHIFRFINLVKLLRSRPFTEAWIFHHSWRYVVACKFAGIKNIYGYGNNWTRCFLKSPYLSPAEFNVHPIQRATALIQKHGLQLPEKSLFKASTKEIELIKNYLRTKNKPWIVVGIGGTEKFKKWPADSFAALAAHLSLSGTVFILGGRAEEAEAAYIVEKCASLSSGNPLPIPLTHLSIEESLAFLSLSDLFIGNDTGMMNFAAILGKPTIGLFLKSPPLQYKKNLYALMPDESGHISVERVVKLCKDLTPRILQSPTVL